MIQCVFTIDYEIYGDGHGSLRHDVLEPAEALTTIFAEHGLSFVNFVEAVEFERIEYFATDPTITAIRKQIQRQHIQGHEIALHLHPQWANALFEDNRWHLDYSEYNLCTLRPTRIAQILDRSLKYLRDVLSDHTYVPISFRAGNWLFQPTQPAAAILASRGLRIDSSVFKGGIQHLHNLDYRAATANGYYWRFRDDAAIQCSSGPMLELPIYTHLVPFWMMLTSKRISLDNRRYKSSPPSGATATAARLRRFRDYLRIRYPLKFDFCRMTLSEMINMVERVVSEDRNDPDSFRPIVAIGHTKDLTDFDSLKAFLRYLQSNGIGIRTLRDVFPKCET